MRRPSPALVVSVIALVGAWGGPAAARTLFTGADIKNGSLTTSDVKDRNLRGRDLASNTVTGRNVSGLTGRDILANGIDGSDIDEDSLEEVPNAAHATRADSVARADSAGALDNAAISRIAYGQPAGTSTVTLFEGGGLVLQARCTEAGTLIARAAASGAAGGVVRYTVTHPGTPAETTLLTDNDFTATDGVDLVAGGADNATGHLVYWAPDGQVTTIDLLAEEGFPASRGYQCAVAGTAVRTSP